MGEDFDFPRVPRQTKITPKDSEIKEFCESLEKPFKGTSGTRSARKGWIEKAPVKIAS